MFLKHSSSLVGQCIIGSHWWYILNSVVFFCKAYWSRLRACIQHICKGVLRVALYVKENGHLSNFSFGSPPLYTIESDDLDDRAPMVRLEVLFEYVHLSLWQLDPSDQQTKLRGLKDDRTELTDENTKSLYLNVLNALVSLIEMAEYVRDSLMIKRDPNVRACGFCLVVGCEYIANCLKQIYN